MWSVEFIHPQVQELLGATLKVTIKTKNELQARLETPRQINSHVGKKRRLGIDKSAIIVVDMGLWAYSTKTHVDNMSYTDNWLN